MDRVERLKKFITEAGFKNMQTFSSRNFALDPMSTIYEKDGITVDYCYKYEYLEIFGLSKKEYSSLKDVLDIY